MVVLVLCLSMAFPISANDFLFTSIDTSHGLSDNQIRYILQLPDGRMVFTTTQNVNLYDGANFTSLQPTPEYIYPLKQYKGFYHVYLSGDSLLWIKDYQRLMCINLHNERYIANLDSVFQQKGMQHPIEDLFADERGLVWVISHGELLQPELSFRLKLSEGRGTIQDLTADEESLYLFHDTGEIVCYDVKNGKQQYDIAAYPRTEQEKFQNTSLILRGKTGSINCATALKEDFSISTSISEHGRS